MPMTMYVCPESIPQTTDPDICSELKACRVAGLRVPIVEERHWETPRRWWQKRQPPTILFRLFVPLSDCECQVIAFFGPGIESGICTDVPKQALLAYLYGYLTSGD